MTPEAMAQLHATGFERGWSAAEFEALLAKPTTGRVTSEQGFAILQILPPEAEILAIVVDPGARGQGFGADLLKRTINLARRREARILFLEVDAENAPARRLYSRALFQETGRRRGYYRHADGRRSDALTLRLDL